MAKSKMASLKSHIQTGYTDVTATDLFLKNPELKAMTFSHLQVENVKKHQWLLNVALTCKDFLDVALNALWEELDSLVPLLKLLPALQVEDKVLSGNVSQADLDRLQYYAQKVKVFSASAITDDPQVHPSTCIRIAQLQPPALFPSLRRLRYDCKLGDGSIPHIFLFLSPLLDSLILSNISGFENTIVGPFLATLSSQMLRRITLRSGRMSVDILKKSIYHFKQLRSLMLHDAVFMSDFGLWGVLGTLPCLENFALTADDPASHPAHAPKNSNSQSGGPKYFEALESLWFKGSYFLFQHLLGFIDSSYLKSIQIYPTINHVNNEDESEDIFTPSMTIIASKWPQSLKILVIGACVREPSVNGAPRFRYTSKRLILSTVLTGLHEMQTFHLKSWIMENMDDDVRRLVKSWPKLKSLNLNQTTISLSTLRIIAENCPELRRLHVRLDTSAIPPFDTSNSKSLRHNLEVLTVEKVLPSSTTRTQTTLEYQIQVSRHLDLIFPYLKSIEVQSKDVIWSGIRDLVRLCQNAGMSRA